MYNNATRTLMHMRPEISEPVSDWKGKKILIVEDDYVNYLYFHEILSRSKANLIRAVSLQEAFDMIASSTIFSLMIINTGMPGNENCRSIKRIKQLWPEIRIIAVAGSGCNERDHKCYPSGCDTLISHNVDGFEIMTAVNELMDQ